MLHTLDAQGLTHLRVPADRLCGGADPRTRGGVAGWGSRVGDIEAIGRIVMRQTDVLITLAIAMIVLSHVATMYARRRG